MLSHIIYYFNLSLISGYLTLITSISFHILLLDKEVSSFLLLSLSDIFASERVFLVLISFNNG